MPYLSRSLAVRVFWLGVHDCGTQSLGSEGLGEHTGPDDLRIEDAGRQKRAYPGIQDMP